MDLRVRRLVPIAEYRWGVHWALTVLFWFIVVTPQLVRPVTVAGRLIAFGWWPAAFVLIVLVAAMATDYTARPLGARVRVVVIGMLVYLVLQPLVYFAGHWMGIPTASAADKHSLLVMSRMLAAMSLFNFSMRTSRLMAKRDDSRSLKYPEGQQETL